MLFQRRFPASRYAFPSAMLLDALPHQSPSRREHRAVLAVSIHTTPKTASTPEAAPVPATSTVTNLDDDPSPNIGPREGVAKASPPYIAPRCLSIVTGASRGLGAAIACVLGSRGPPLPSLPAKGGTTAANTVSADGAAGGSCGSIRDPTTSGASATAVHSPSSSSAAVAWSHDVVLLASDPSRLGQFVRAELAPLLEHQQPQQQLSLVQQGLKVGQWRSQQATELEHVRTLLSQPLPPLPQQQEPATAALPTQQAAPSSNPRLGVTRIRTACFDLGDLEGLEANTGWLLSQGSALRATAAPAASGSVSTGISISNSNGSRDAPTQHPLQTASWLPSSTLASVADDAGAASDSYGSGNAAANAGGDDGGSGGDGSGGVAGLLPLPPSAYTHVLLVHNAGQVGDLVPLELQGLVNIRRQTDLNVASFAHLTAAVLRTFLYAPLLEPSSPPPPLSAHGSQKPVLGVDMGNPCAPADASADATAEASKLISSQHGLQQQQEQQQEQQQRQEQQDLESRQRRIITIVNISSVSVDQPYEHFSLYGMGKAARHMIVRSVAHEAALREAGELAKAAAVERAAHQFSSGSTGGGGGGGGLRPAAIARVRALSYAPGAIDTEMQATAREALPAGSLKSRFEDNARNGRLIEPRVSAQVLYDILAADMYVNGGHVDYYSAVAATTAGVAAAATTMPSHPLARRN